jgi:hypothetical protein
MGLTLDPPGRRCTLGCLPRLLPPRPAIAAPRLLYLSISFSLVTCFPTPISSRLPITATLIPRISLPPPTHVTAACRPTHPPLSHLRPARFQSAMATVAIATTGRNGRATPPILARATPQLRQSRRMPHRHTHRFHLTPLVRVVIDQAHRMAPRAEAPLRRQGRDSRGHGTEGI